MNLVYDNYQAPFGLIHIIMDEVGVARVTVTLDGWQECIHEFGIIERDKNRCSNAIIQLDEYFGGKRQQFSVPLSVKGPAFSQRVWRELLAIPFGERRSYADIALAIGKPKSYRGVGQANRRNPLPLFIPCHRVIGKNGALTGYAGKGHVDIKEYLLEMERAYKLKNKALSIKIIDFKNQC